MVRRRAICSSMTERRPRRQTEASPWCAGSERGRRPRLGERSELLTGQNSASSLSVQCPIIGASVEARPWITGNGADVLRAILRQPLAQAGSAGR